jgi:hypothetical protein
LTNPQEIVWEDPPPTARRPGTRKGGKYGVFADQLRRNPTKSAKLGEFASTEAARAFANSVEHGRKAGFKDGVWEAAVEGKWVWVKFIRDDDPADAAAPEASDGTDDADLDDEGPDPFAEDGGE